MHILIMVMALILITNVAGAEEYKGVKIAPTSHEGTYKRSLYRHWVDADRDKLDTRQEVLIEESRAQVTIITKPNGKRAVTDGLWIGPYANFKTTDPGKLDVDHMVPLKEAHISGAWAWGKNRKKAYANYMTHKQHLIAVKAGENRSKGAKDPTKYMPKVNKCRYLIDWVEVKRRWGLSMDRNEVDYVKAGLQACGR